MSNGKTHIKEIASIYDILLPKIWETMNNDESTYNIHVGLFNNDQEPFLVAQQRMTDELIEPLEINENKKVLDVGCGVGLPAIKICEKYNCEIQGITISDKQLQISKDLLKKTKVAKKPKFTHMDAHSMNFPDDYFDAVYALESLAHMDRLIVLKELHRVLSAGGKIAICDFYMRKPITMKEKSIVEANFHSNLITLSELPELLTKSGFKNIILKDWSKRVHPTYKFWKMIYQNMEKIFSKEEIDAYQVNLKNFIELFDKKAGYFMISAEKPNK